MATFFATGLFDSTNNVITKINLLVDPTGRAIPDNSTKPVGEIISQIKSNGIGTESTGRKLRFSSENVNNLLYRIHRIYKLIWLIKLMRILVLQ